MRATLEKLRQVPLRDRVANAICDAILAGQIRPGDKIPEQVLAEQLGTSRVPVREAIRILELQGLVVTRPKTGTYVAELTQAELDDSSRVRAVLEELAVTQAIERLTEEEWTQLCDVLEELLEQMRETGRKQTWSSLVERDWQWHTRLIEASGNRALGQIWRTLGLPVRLVLSRRMTERKVEDWRATIGHHDELLLALRGRNVAECQRAVRFHVLRRFTDAVEPPAVVSGVEVAA